MQPRGKRQLERGHGFGSGRGLGQYGGKRGQWGRYTRPARPNITRAKLPSPLQILEPSLMW